MEEIQYGRHPIPNNKTHKIEIMEKQQRKTAPYMGYGIFGGGGLITWEAHLKAWEGYCEEYGPIQSAEIVADRGGFGASELDEFYPEWKNYIVK
jgi:hypothetical protein